MLMPTYFTDAAVFRAWLSQHAAGSSELVVGVHKAASGTPGMSWPEAVDEALCVGWIDGVRKRIDDQRYQIRFTPRRPGSRRSAVNIERVAVLAKEGRMRPAGLAICAHRTEAKSRTASYEQEAMPVLDAAAQAFFQGHAAAWKFFEAQAPSYRRKVIWLIVSAKQEVTRQRRLAALVEASRKGLRL